MGLNKLEQLNSLLYKVIELDGSDLHLQVGSVPRIRIHGKLTPVANHHPLTNEELKDMVFSILTEARRERFLKELELDLSYSLDSAARFRVNVFQQRGCIGAVFRLIPVRIPTIDELNLPQVLKEISQLRRGLVLVTGPTGAGKSTTLAATIDYINNHRCANIITIEDPIEYLHQDKLSCISQREIGSDVADFQTALRYVMRQNPDVILVGEMRDLETMQATITAAETGVLVFATLHTNNAVQTVDRIIEVFPAEQQQQIRAQLAETLQAIFSQVLIPKIDGSGRVAAFEVLIVTPAVRNLLRLGKSHQLYSIIQSSAQYKMHTLERDLARLYRENLISYEDALAHAPNVAEFELLSKRT